MNEGRYIFIIVTLLITLGTAMFAFKTAVDGNKILWQMNNRCFDSLKACRESK